MSHLQQTINAAFDDRANIDPTSVDPALLQTLEEVLAGLETGDYRVAESTNTGDWSVNDWIKKAILLYFRAHANTPSSDGVNNHYDKVPLRYANYNETDFIDDQVRVVPGAVVRRGAHIGPDVVLMPSFVNIGAYVGEGTLVDTWATVGSCAQIGKHVHLSGGAGIGGVLEPLQANPTIIEDNCFIGARSEIVEGVIVEQGSVLSMGVYIGQSTPIYNRQSDEVSYGRIPAGSVVVPGSLPDKGGKCHLNAAVIVKQVDEKTRSKTAINELLRY